MSHYTQTPTGTQQIHIKYNNKKLKPIPKKPTASEVLRRNNPQSNINVIAASPIHYESKNESIEKSEDNVFETKFDKDHENNYNRDLVNTRGQKNLSGLPPMTTTISNHFGGGYSGPKNNINSGYKKSGQSKGFINPCTGYIPKKNSVNSGNQDFNFNKNIQRPLVANNVSFDNKNGPNFHTINNQEYPKPGKYLHNEMNNGVNKCSYLKVLLQEKKHLQDTQHSLYAPMFHRTHALLDEEIAKVRASLFSSENKALETLPDSDGTNKKKYTEKIFIPVDKHPNYNFVGRILGPRGQTAKQLEKDYCCKLMIRGEGSLRSKEKEDKKRGQNNWEHLSEPLHILITIEETEERAKILMARAKEVITSLLVPHKEGEDELKKKQLMELAIINGTYRDSSAGIKENKPNMNLFPVTIPPHPVAFQPTAILTPQPLSSSQQNRYDIQHIPLQTYQWDGKQMVGYNNVSNSRVSSGNVNRASVTEEPMSPNPNSGNANDFAMAQAQVQMIQQTYAPANLASSENPQFNRNFNQNMSNSNQVQQQVFYKQPQFFNGVYYINSHEYPGYTLGHYPTLVAPIPNPYHDQQYDMEGVMTEQEQNYQTTDSVQPEEEKLEKSDENEIVESRDKNEEMN